MRVTVREAQAAHSAVAKAIAAGEMTREWCEVCGAEAQAHHDDYSRPLDVRWLCPSHHKLWHRDHPSGIDWTTGRTQLFSFRCPGELVDQLSELAEANYRNLSQEIRLALVKHVKAATETA
jgi:hypothetical protein